MTSLRTFLTRRYNLNQTLTILVPSVAASVTVEHAADLLGAPHPMRTAVSIAIAITSVVVLALLVNRRANA